MIYLAPSLSAAFVGSLAFVLLWRWLSLWDPTAQWRQERIAVQSTLEAMRKREEEFRTEMARLSALVGDDVKKLATRVDSLEMKTRLRP